MARKYGGIEFSLTGLDDLRTMIRALTTKQIDLVGEALEQEMQIEVAASQEIVPYLSGNLKRSARVHPFTVSASRGGIEFAVKATYGGGDVPYAIVQHERLTFEHDDGEAKFLEKTLRESRKFMGQRIAKRLWDIWTRLAP